MAFVHVEHGRSNAQFAHQAHAANAEQHFLHDARGAVTAINAQRQIAVGLFVLRNIRIEQINGATAHDHFPRLERHGRETDFDFANQRLPIGAEHRLHRQIIRIQRPVIIDLPILAVDRLLKIALAVKETDAHQPDSEVTGRLQMIPRQHAETTCSNRQGFVKTELRGEIGDRIFVQEWRVLVRPRILVLQISVELL